MKMVDVIIQGGLWNITASAVKAYRELPFVNRIIFSTWENHEIPGAETLVNEFPENPGPCNINLQLISSLNGLKLATSDYAIKVRSDELVDLSPVAASIEKERISVISVSSKHPYHPQDHLFAGKTKSLIDLMSCRHETSTAFGSHTPFNNKSHVQRDKDLDWKHSLVRPNIYIGTHYCARFNDEANNHVSDPMEFLTDEAPRRSEALENSRKILLDYFKPLPRINIAWEKYGSYPYNFYAAEGEVTA